MMKPPPRSTLLGGGTGVAEAPAAPGIEARAWPYPFDSAEERLLSASLDGPEVFSLPFGGRQIIYHPRRRLAFSGNRALADCLQARGGGGEAAAPGEVEEFLRAVGFDGPAIGCEVPRLPVPFRPDHAVLLMTNQCNLRCSYCYANAGESGPAAVMPWAVARTVIDAAVENAAASATVPAVTFHGGGEPTVHWRVMERAVRHARDLHPGARLSMSSNGVWSKSQREFICARFDSVSLSLDGLREVQDRQRPRAGGAGSFASVMESVRALEDAGIDFGVRMTVLPETVGRLGESVRFLCERTKAAAIQIEPSFTSRRGLYADLDDSFADAFAEAFAEAWETGRRAGRQVYYSGARPWVVSPLFCVAPLQAMVATADGRLVTCFEVFSADSPLAASSTVGRVEDGSVVFDQAALGAYLERQQERRAECRDCFCYWHCSGDCTPRRPATPARHRGRCRATRSITMQLLVRMMAEGGGFWRGTEAPASPGDGSSQADPPETRP